MHKDRILVAELLVILQPKWSNDLQHFSPDWVRQAVGEAQSDQSTGHVNS